ncbi:MAG: hypothetical protein RLP45_10610, partial [Haliea sp.]
MTAMDQSQLEFIYDPLVYEQAIPFESLAALRAQGPVVWVEEHQLPQWPGGKGFWFVTRHAEVQQALKSAKIFSSQVGGTQL